MNPVIIQSIGLLGISTGLGLFLRASHVSRDLLNLKTVARLSLQIFGLLLVTVYGIFGHPQLDNPLLSSAWTWIATPIVIAGSAEWLFHILRTCLPSIPASSTARYLSLLLLGLGLQIFRFG
jgi:hypothetical protein